MADPTLSISTENVCFLIVKAREFEVNDVATDTESASSAGDDDLTDVLENSADDPTKQEIEDFVDMLSEEEWTDLVALMRLGRGDGTLEDWEDLRSEADGQHNTRTAAYLLGEPLLADYLQEGLAQLGLSCSDFEIDRP